MFDKEVIALQAVLVLLAGSLSLVSPQGVSLTLNGPSKAPAEAPLPLVDHYYV